MKIIKWLKSPNKIKKYRVIFADKTKVDFGSVYYQHYSDKTPLKLYSYLDHNDARRRKSYHLRHKAILDKSGQPAYKDRKSAAYLSLKYLW